MTLTADRFEALPVVIPLPEPIKVFGKFIREWDFMFLRVYSGARYGTGFTLSSGLPLDEIVRRQIAHRD